MKREGVTVTALFLTASVAALASPKSWTPAWNQIAELESSVRLEKLPGGNAGGSSSLAGYERFYTGSGSKGRKVILGEFVLPTSPGQHPGIHIVTSTDKFPQVEGGGCTIIHLVYSVPKSAILSIDCNGSI